MRSQNSIIIMLYIHENPHQSGISRKSLGILESHCVIKCAPAPYVPIYHVPSMV